MQSAAFDRKEAAPRFLEKPQSCAVIAGQSVRFTCRVVAPDGPPAVTWIHEAQSLPQSVKYMQRYSFTTGGVELKINRVKIEDTG